MGILHLFRDVVAGAGSAGCCAILLRRRQAGEIAKILLPCQPLLHLRRQNNFTGAMYHRGMPLIRRGLPQKADTERLAVPYLSV